MVARSLARGVLAGSLLLFGARHAAAVPLGTAFTYQGQLQHDGSTVTGTCDLQFAPFDAAADGTQVATTVTVSPVTVTNGLFTVELDLGNGIFNGQDRWLEIGVRCPVGTGSFTILTPRQKVTATPYALFSAGIADNAVTSSKIADGSITANDVSFGYAASASPGGPAFDVSFPYAGSISKGGAANDVACSGCVNTADLQDSGVSAPKISPAGSLSGQVLTSTGSAVTWQPPLTLPFASTVASASDAFSITNTSTGRAIYGKNSSLSTTDAAIVGEDQSGGNGVIGRAGKFGTDSGSGVYGEHLGLGAGVTGVGLGFGVGVRGINSVAGGVAGDFQGRLRVSVTSGDIATFQFSNVNQARIDGTGKGFFNGGTQSSGADVAEFVKGSGALHPGDVVEIDALHPDHFRLAATPNSTAVAGVISTAPGVTLNAKDGATAAMDGPQLALVGRVPVKVSAENGPIQPGDLLVASSTPGHAMRSPHNPAPGTVIGKAMSALDSGVGVSEMLVMLR